MPDSVRYGWRLFALLLAAGLLSGCGGWQLRGAGAAGAAVTGYTWRTADQSAAMADVLEALRRGGLEAESADSSASGPVVELQALRETRRSVSVADRSRTAEYELISMLRYRVVDAQGKELLDGAPLREQRDYFVDRDNIMGSSAEEEQLRREMRRQLGNALLRALATVMPVAS